MAGLKRDGQLVTELEDVSGGKGRRLSLVRLVEKGGIPEAQVVCGVSKARARRGKASRVHVKALAMPAKGNEGERACNKSNEEAAGGVGAGTGGWVRLQAGDQHGCLHGGGGCGLLCKARLGWWGSVESRDGARGHM